jgi:hypothetical protein
MNTDYDYLSKKPLLWLRDLLDLIFKIPLQKAGYPSPEHERIAKVQSKFLQLILDSLIAGTLTAVNDDWKSIRPGIWFFLGKKEIICNWISENKILDWLNDEGIKVSSETVKILNSNEPQRDPHPLTRKARLKRLHENYVAKAVEMFQKNEELKWPFFKDNDSLKTLIRDSKSSPADSTLQKKWIPEARKKANVVGKPGTPKKK